MWYNKSKIAVLDPQTGYNKAAKIYKTFHKGLASYDKGLFQRFLPRSVRDKVILDIWSGDARMHSYFADKGIAKYIWFDCAELLLKRAPSRVEKVSGDIEDVRPFEDASIDIALAFFVLIHIRDLNHFLEEAKRVLKPGGNLIMLHNFQRREYVYELPNETFKIQDYHWKPSEVQETAEEIWFTVEQILLEEKGADIGILYNMSINQ
jgi:ubiquinone/menaquinone biosynthesis C-methylase UbiE